MRSALWLTVALNALTAYAATTPSRTTLRRQNDASQFINSANGQFTVNGSEFRFIGTNAYWLPFLNSDEDISNTLANMSASGITVVRTWGFNDVTSIPTNGTWLQLIANGTATINNGTNGLQRLDKVVELAQQHGIYVLFSLTNNWNPLPNVTLPATLSRRNDTPPATTPLPRNFLSNSYGGMDAYVREFGLLKQHDEFYVNETIKDIFNNYTKQVISRFVDNPWVLGWELANDPRCNSTIPTSDSCDTQTVTKWHADTSKFVRSVDPNHLVSSGNQGFLCPDCPKLFPLTPAPQPSPAPGARRRSVSGAMTKARLMRDIVERRKARRAASTDETQDGPKIRGRWSSGAAKRQSSGTGDAFNGQHGVDSQDILNIPDIGFGTFQYIPDQNTYSTDGQAAADFNATVQEGVNWIQTQQASAQAVGKPLALTSFGLVTQNNSQFFVPFNSTTPISTTTSGLQKRADTFASDDQQVSAYDSWLDAGINAGLGGMTQYQWSAGGLTAGGFVGGQGSDPSATDGQSPNDGYGSQGSAQTAEQQALSNANAQLQQSS